MSHVLSCLTRASRLGHRRRGFRIVDLLSPRRLWAVGCRVTSTPLPFSLSPFEAERVLSTPAACVQNPKAHAFQHFEIFRCPEGELDSWKCWLESSNEEEEEEEEADKAGY
jgi:hypothetical protein